MTVVNALTYENADCSGDGGNRYNKVEECLAAEAVYIQHDCQPSHLHTNVFTDSECENEVKLQDDLVFSGLPMKQAFGTCLKLSDTASIRVVNCTDLYCTATPEGGLSLECLAEELPEVDKPAATPFWIIAVAVCSAFVFGGIVLTGINCWWRIKIKNAEVEPLKDSPFQSVGKSDAPAS